MALETERLTLKASIAFLRSAAYLSVVNYRAQLFRESDKIRERNERVRADKEAIKRTPLERAARVTRAAASGFVLRPGVTRERGADYVRY